MSEKVVRAVVENQAEQMGRGLAVAIVLLLLAVPALCCIAAAMCGLMPG